MTDIAVVLDHFETVDSKLYGVASRVYYEEWMGEEYSPSRYFERLCRAIVGQQLAGKAAEAIYGRLVARVGSRYGPHELLQTDHETLRSLGLSNAKALSIRDLAEKTKNGLLPFKSFVEMANDAILDSLIAVRGIGQWTAEMFMMFTLKREDIYSHGDLGLKKGMQKLYGLRDYPTLAEAEKISAVWSPYRTYACCVLWEVVDSG